MNKLNDTYGAVELRGKKFAYDGENGLYTVGRLDFQSKEFLVILEEGRKSGGPRSVSGPAVTLLCNPISWELGSKLLLLGLAGLVEVGRRTTRQRTSVAGPLLDLGRSSLSQSSSRQWST